MWSGETADVEHQKTTERKGSWQERESHRDGDGLLSILSAAGWRPMEGQEGQRCSFLSGSQLWTGLNPEKVALDNRLAYRPPKESQAS